MKHLKKLLLVIIFFISHNTFANLPYYPITFPRDEAAHNSNTPYSITNLTEWWYYNGKFTTTDGRNFGYCVFYLYQQKIKDGQKTLQPMIYFLLADIDKQKTYKLISFDIPVTKLDAEKLDVAFGNDITLHLEPDNIFSIHLQVKTNDGTEIKLALDLRPSVNYPVMLNNKIGLIKLWDHTNSYYYSRTHLQTVTGSLRINNDSYTVNPAKSLSWMDHQWGDFVLNPLLHPWVWASIQLDNGMDLNVMGLYHSLEHKIYPLVSNILLPNGVQYFHTSDLQYIPGKIAKDQRYPTSYTLLIKPLNLSLELDALVQDQFVGNIWEGVSSATGTFQGQSISGQSYTENTSILP